MAKVGAGSAVRVGLIAAVAGSCFGVGGFPGACPPAWGQFRGAAPAGDGDAARDGAKFYPDTSSVADALLRNASAHVRDGQWAEAIDIYRRVIDQFGDILARLPNEESAPPGDLARDWAATKGWGLNVRVRSYCNLLLATLPPEGRALYRSRVDAQAEGWYRRGAAERDRASLRKVVEQAFCSSRGDDALNLLGDLAFQDGRFAEALGAYRQLVPDRPGEALGLVHPDPDVDLARVAAKKLLCRAALGEDAPTPADLEAFAAAYPKARGKLAGREGPLVKDVAAALAADHLAPPVQLDGRWPTFAGASSRSKVAPGTIDVGSFQWRYKLEPVQAGRVMNQMMGMRHGFGAPAPAPAGDPIPAYHPIILNDQVVIADDHQIAAFNLNDRPEPQDGKEAAVEVAWRHDATQGKTPSARGATVGAARYTLTASGDRVYARLGDPPANPGRGMGMGGMGMGMGGMMSGVPASYIVAVQRSTEGKVLWRRAAVEVELPHRGAEAGARRVSFEGTPVADARGVYVALTDAGPMTATYVACLDAETGAARWSRYVGEAQVQAPNPGGMMGMGMLSEVESGSRLLSLDGPTVYYQTNLGAVAALDAETGSVRWLATYPRQDRPGGSAGRERDLNPAIVAEGRVIVAPDDSPAIFALDAATGRLAWKTPPMPDVVHLLGVAKGRLFATGNHVTSIDVKTGKVLTRWPDSETGFPGFGRGILAGEQVYWPTRTEIHILDQATGLRSDRPPIQLQEKFGTGGGNLVAGDGYLIVAQPEALVVFCQNSRLIQRYRDEIAREPGKASIRYRLAQVAEAVGDEALALESLADAARMASPSEVVDGQPLGESARGHEHRLLMKLGGKAAAAQDWPAAARRFTAAAEAAGADRDRLAARLRLAEAQAAAADGPAAVATLQRLLVDDRLRSLTVAADDRRTVRADLVIADRLVALIRDRGRGVYAEYDRRAADLLDRGKAEKDPRLLEEVGRSFPVALVAPEALMALGRLCEATRQPAVAAHAYKRLLAGAPDDPARARALLGLGRAYAAQRLWASARDAFTQARSRFGDLSIEDDEAGSGSPAKVAALVEARLARPPFDRLAGDGPEPDLPIPLARRRVARWDGAARPIGAEGVPPSGEAGRIFLADRNALRLVDPASGSVAWTAEMGGQPAWVGYLADRVLIATDTRLVALAPDTGRAVWENDLGGKAPALAEANPFARGEPDEARRGAGRLHDFRVVGNRVFCRRGDRELLALDGDTGMLEWSFAPAGEGYLGPHLWVGPRRIVLQVRKPNAIVVLETDGGRRRIEAPQAEEAEEWAREPLPLDDDHVALVIDRRTVALLDLNKAATAWSFREADSLPTNGPPRLLGDAERLLVLHTGTRLIRLNPKDGHGLWSRPLGTDDLSERPEAIALDGDRFYWVSASISPAATQAAAVLEAVALADGSTLWRRFLAGPPTGWALALTRRCIVAYPLPSRPAGGDLDGLPLAFCRRDTGELVQRVLLPTSVSELAVRLAPRGLLVATQDALWALGDRRATLPAGPSR